MQIRTFFSSWLLLRRCTAGSRRSSLLRSYYQKHTNIHSHLCRERSNSDPGREQAEVSISTQKKREMDNIRGICFSDECDCTAAVTNSPTTCDRDWPVCFIRCSICSLFAFNVDSHFDLTCLINAACRSCDGVVRWPLNSLKRLLTSISGHERSNLALYYDFHKTSRQIAMVNPNCMEGNNVGATHNRNNKILFSSCHTVQISS